MDIARWLLRTSQAHPDLPELYVQLTMMASLGSLVRRRISSAIATVTCNLYNVLEGVVQSFSDLRFTGSILLSASSIVVLQLFPQSWTVGLCLQIC